MATAVAFAPSFALVMLGAPYFERLRASRRARDFLDGAGPAAAGAILGAAVPLLDAVDATWQWVVLAAAGARADRRVPPIWVLVAAAWSGVATTL